MLGLSAFRHWLTIIHLSYILRFNQYLAFPHFFPKSSLLSCSLCLCVFLHLCFGVYHTFTRSAMICLLFHTPYHRNEVAMWCLGMACIHITSFMSILRLYNTIQQYYYWRRASTNRFIDTACTSTRKWDKIEQQWRYCAIQFISCHICHRICHICHPWMERFFFTILALVS